MEYTFKPKKFYLLTLGFTWIFWIVAAILSHFSTNESDVFFALAMAFMFVGLIVPSVMAFIFVKKSGCEQLKRDYKEKIFGFFRITLWKVILAILVFSAVIFASIGISLLFGESKNQFGLVEGFSFSIGGMPTLLLLIITALFEELGWRGYAEDSIAQYCSWFKESVIFGFLWSIWHAPLFFIQGTYQANILAMNPWYMVNFFVGIIPLGFFFTWVYVGNKRSIFACSLVHFAVNFLQEQINMSQNTKCIETFVVSILAVILVVLNKDMFFEKRHIGNILG
ncbi:MAG: CPBP family intramembrane metalloprotease [Treponema sp.]|nr:CPBP family intramembrane metalloprotease [Treponema sp.]